MLPSGAIADVAVFDAGDHADRANPVAFAKASAVVQSDGAGFGLSGLRPELFEPPNEELPKEEPPNDEPELSSWAVGTTVLLKDRVTIAVAERERSNF